MKKVLFLLLCAFLLFFIYSLVVTSCGASKSKEAKYIEFCETDSLSVGYEYLFTYNDSVDMVYSVFNPFYADVLTEYSNLKLTYADTSDVVSAKGYYLVLRGLDEKVAKFPKGSKVIKITRDADWPGFIKWRDDK